MNDIVYSKRSNNPTPSIILVGDVVNRLESLTADRRVIVVTDQHLLDTYPELITRYPYIVIGCGESNKNLATVEHIHRELLALQADRTAYLVGIGGGIVTDITGFAASTYMRGVSFGFIATSLLAQVDASVGGKNGVNLDGYKNIIGTFSQPDFVLCDSSMLRTLPLRELRAGMSEALKCGIIGEKVLFDIFVEHTFDQIMESEKLLHEIVLRSVRFKANIVEQDEREGSLRKLLNLGHTFAHSVEKCTTKYIHGEAVAIGIAIIARLSNTDIHTYTQIITALEKLSLPTSVDIEFERLLEVAKSDKKRSGDSIELIIIEKIGQCKIQKMAIDELLKLR